MPRFLKAVILPTAVALLGAGCEPAPAGQMIAGVYDLSSSQFGLRVIAPADQVRDYAVCKATGFAEEMKAATMSLGNPEYKTAQSAPGLAGHVPAGWAVLDMKVYLTSRNPDGNPAISVPEQARTCRSLQQQ